MRYRELVFDLYGTLVDIHTEEDDHVWEHTAYFFGFYGAHYTGPELKTAFAAAMRSREAAAGQNYECFPDIPCETVFAELFRDKGITERADELGFQGPGKGIGALQLWRNDLMGEGTHLNMDGRSFSAAGIMPFPEANPFQILF